MTTKAWAGGTGDYALDSNWVGGKAPQAGDSATFAAGTLQIGSITIPATTDLLVSNGDYQTELHVQMTDTTIAGLVHTDALGAASNGDAEAYDIAGTVTVAGTISGAQAYGLMDFNDLSASATLHVGASGVISDASADLNFNVATLVNDGSIGIVNGAEYIASQTVTGSGVFTLATQPPGTSASNLISIVHGVASGVTFALVGAGEAELDLGDVAHFGGTITGINAFSDIHLANIQADAAHFNAGTLTVSLAGTTVATLAVGGSYTDTFTVNHTSRYGIDAPSDSFIRFGAVACFATGTRIATPGGEVAVELLAVGDVVVLSGGDTATVAWLGHRHVECRRHPRPATVQPVRIRAGAFAPGLPHRDLLLSPDHAVFLEGVLIPVKYLLNGSTVRQEDAGAVTYWHVELPRHAVLLAEGLPAESYLDTGNRTAFANGGGASMLHPDFSPSAQAIWEAESCAPLVLAGAPVARARAALAAHAAALKVGATPHGAPSRTAVRTSSWPRPGR